MLIRRSTSRVFKTIVRTGLFLFLFCALLLFSVFPARYMKACLDGVSLWAACVLPSALPFLFITGLFTRLGFVHRLSKNCAPVTSALFRLSGVSGYCILMSFLSGYPVGAKTLCDLKEQNVVSASEATKMSVLCSSSGPLFILGSVGMGMFSDVKIGIILLLSHFIAVLLSGIIFRFYPTAPSENFLPSLKRADNVLYECMYSSVLSVLVVGGFVAVFYTLSVMLADCRILTPIAQLLRLCAVPDKTARAFATGLVEMTGGCKSLAASPCVLNVALCAFLITFGGISALFQQIVYLKRAEVKLGLFLSVKLLQSVLAALFAFLFYYIFPFAAPFRL